MKIPKGKQVGRVTTRRAAAARVQSLRKDGGHKGLLRYCTFNSKGSLTRRSRAAKSSGDSKSCRTGVKK